METLFVIFLSFVSLMIWLGLASVGHEFWLLSKYVSLLVRIFEYGRKKTEIADNVKEQKMRKLSRIEEEKGNPWFNLEDEGDEGVSGDGKKMNGGISNDSILDDSILDEAEEADDVLSPATNIGGSVNSVLRARSCSLNITQPRLEKHQFELNDIADFVRVGIQAIVDDQVTKRFKAEELSTWNLLTRTDKFYHYTSLRLGLLWYLGFLFRYFFLMPLRVSVTTLGVLWLIICMAIIGNIPNGKFKRITYRYVSIMCFRVLSRGFSGIITYHNPENRAKGGGICVANHTSPIDVVVLHCDNSYALVGQMHGGFLGVICRALARATHHIWFDRFEMKDREAVTGRLKEHVEDTEKLPILIFPEGTCINNSAVMMFKKGSFEVGGKIHPVAIKYDPKFGDPFWDSSKYGYMKYLLMMMTSWAIVCDVWYLPPMVKEEGESSIDFANRVKSEIAIRGGLVDLAWDGQLKRIKVKPEFKARQQFKYSQSIKVD